MNKSTLVKPHHNVVYRPLFPGVHSCPKNATFGTFSVYGIHSNPFYHHPISGIAHMKKDTRLSPSSRFRVHIPSKGAWEWGYRISSQCSQALLYKVGITSLIPSLPLPSIYSRYKHSTTSSMVEWERACFSHTSDVRRVMSKFAIKGLVVPLIFFWSFFVL